MLCEKCKKNQATVYVTKVINDQKSEYVLCIDCARGESGFPAGLEGAVSVDSLLKGFFNSGKAVSPKQEVPDVVCPVCGMTMAKLADKGRFGCNECYKVFGDAVLKTIRHVHGRKRHIGKIPKRASGLLGVKRRLADLRTKLEAHVIKEEYEEAARLRDEMRLLEKELSVVAEVNDDGR